MYIQKKLRSVAIYSRVFIIFVQYFANIIVPDHNAHVFEYPKTDASYYTIADNVVTHFWGGFARWDAQYFMHIARYGYTYENNLAFFPLYPYIVRLISLILYSVFPIMSLDSILLLVFIGSNIIIFVFAVKLLFNLTSIIFNDKIAYKSSVLFCFNPASIFFTAPYTECLFCYLTFYSIWNCLMIYKKYSDPHYNARYMDFLYLIPIMLSTIVRSNGVLNIGFLIYSCICLYKKNNLDLNFITKIKSFLKYVFIIFCLAVICLGPFIIFQIYCYKMFCTNFQAELPRRVVDYAEIKKFIVPGSFSKYNQSWCYDKIPLAYSYVQNHYWNVGFLKYYTVKQIPNFLLATPTLFIVIRFCCQHIKHNFTSNILYLFSFDLLFKKKKSINSFLEPQLNVFVIHALFLSIFSILFTHIQITTRMICSASPLFYWACVSYFQDTNFNNILEIINIKGSFGQYLLKIYFLIYFVIGTVLFSNFLPWT